MNPRFQLYWRYFFAALGVGYGTLLLSLLLDTRGLAGLLAASLVIPALAGVASVVIDRRLRAELAAMQRHLLNDHDDLPAVIDPSLRPLGAAVQQVSRDLHEALARHADDRGRLLAVLEGMDDAVVATDEGGLVTLANSAARQLLAGDDSPVGRALLDLIRAPTLHKLVDRVCGGHHDVAELDLPGPPERHFLVRGAPQRNGGAVLVLQDSTRLRQLEQMRREFVANVSHELRTPVSVIRANAETLLDGAIDDPEFARGFLDALVRNADRLAALVSDLLDLSRVESGRYPIERHRMAPSAPVRTVIAALAQTARDAGLQLTEGAFPQVESYADPKAVEQVLTNLVHNAIKYSPSGGVVHISASADDDVVHFSVADNGPGIPLAQRGRIFERFYRVDKGRSRDVGGTGLGLAIVRSLVHEMGGEVGVGDATGALHGAEFWFTLPRFRSVFDDEGGRSYVRVAVAHESAHLPVESTLDPRIQELRRRLVLMAGKVEEMIAHSVRAVQRGDADLARRTIAADRSVNRDEIEADELCLRLLEHPPANDADLRFITRALKMVTDLERIADLAVNICERVDRLRGAAHLAPSDEIPRMAAIVQRMVRDVIDAFVSRDAQGARQVILRDDDVDSLYHDVSGQLMTLMAANPELVEPGIHVQAVAKFLERMADHATNLGEQVVFMVHGDEIRHPGKLLSPPNDTPAASQRALFADQPDPSSQAGLTHGTRAP